MKSQHDLYYSAQKVMSDSNNTFLHILPSLTLKEFNLLCNKRPYLYEKYRKLVENTLK